MRYFLPDHAIPLHRHPAPRWGSRLPRGRAPAYFSSVTATLKRHTDSDPRAADEQRLLAWFRTAGSVLIGFSGGVDSAYLACVAVEALGPEHVLAVIGRSASYPEEQWSRALGVARHAGIPVLEVDTDELSDPRYAANPSNRCYFCKSELWARLVPIARERGFAVVVDGTNADDVRDFRPGRQAADERGIRSPLAELGFRKQDIRRLSEARGLPTWSVPSSPCLSSRLPYGLAVTPERLRQVERAEAALRTLAVKGNLRVRHHGDLARVELDAAELSGRLSREGLQTLRDAVAGEGFPRVTVELGGFRSGSLNLLDGIHGPPVTPAPADGRATRLANALRVGGYACRVEERDRLAVLVPEAAMLDADLAGFRVAAVALARESGFTHVALEIPSRGAIRAAAEESRESGHFSAGAAVPGD